MGQWQLEVGRRIGVHGPIDFTPARVGQTLHLPCARGHRVDYPLNKPMPPEAVAKDLMKKGWTVGSKLLCPKHARKTKAIPAPVPGEQEEPMSEPEIALPAGVELPPPAVSAKAPASDRARAAQREALNWLGESFNVEKGTYAKDVSDATIAKETGLAVAVVIKLREDFYGPLKAPGEVEEMRGAIKRLRSDISENGETLRQAIRTLELRLDRLCEKNGW